MTNPVEDYFTEKTAASAQRKEEEVALWRRWMENGKKPEHLAPLLKRFEPIFAQKVRLWRPPMVPESAFKAELQLHAIKAFDTYDPSRGAALNTHVEARLPKAMRYGNRGANAMYIPEGVAGQIGKLNKSRDVLTEELGRAPTTDELADHMGLPPKRVETILKSVKRDVPMSRSGGPEGFDYGTSDHTNRGFEEQQIAVAQHILPDIFPGNERMHQLFGHVFGVNGHEHISSTSELAKRMGMSQSQVSRMKTTMGATLRQHFFGTDDRE